MEEIKKEEIKVEVNEDAELDKSLAESLDSLKAGKEPEPEKVEVKPEVPVEEPKVEETSTPPVVELKKEEAYEFRIPNKGKFESDESFEKRIQLLDLVKQRKLAKTDDKKQLISDEIKKTANQLKNLNGTDKIINPLNQKDAVEVKKVEEDDTLKADKERLRELGGVTKEDLEEIVQKERITTETKNTLDKFIERHAELKDIDTREVFFDFVDQNFNWGGKSPKEMMTVLELARESMFKPSETIQERVLKGANVQEKVNAMQFPGGTIAKQTYSPEMKSSIDELKATGMSEEKALELISD